MRLMLFAPLIAALCLLGGCGPGELGKLDRNQSSIYPGESARQLLRQCSRNVPNPVEGTWTPSRAQINELETALEPLLIDELQREPARGVDVRDYYRRYGGFIVGGRRIIYIDADAAGAGLGVCDGGRRLFGAEYDPTTKLISNLQFNGH
jgi:hypothetical protein